MEALLLLSPTNTTCANFTPLWSGDSEFSFN